MLHSARLASYFACAALAGLLATAGAAQDKPETRSPVDGAVTTGSSSGLASLEAAPGLPLPVYGRVWILDQGENKPKLVRIRLTNTVANRHVGENIARSELFVIKEVASVDLLGVASAMRVSSHTPTIFIRKSELEEEELQSAVDPNSTQSRYVLLRLRASDDRRQICSFSYWKFGGKRTRHEDDVETSVEEIAGGEWLKITPKQPLPDGEYAVMRMTDDKTQAGSQPYDFGVGPIPQPPPNP